MHPAGKRDEEEKGKERRWKGIAAEWTVEKMRGGIAWPPGEGGARERERREMAGRLWINPSFYPIFSFL